MIEFQFHCVLHCVVQCGLPPIVEYDLVSRIFQTRRFDFETVVRREYRHLSSYSAIEFSRIVDREGRAVVGDGLDIDAAFHAYIRRSPYTFRYRNGDSSP